jgi:hypothetical protein
VKEPVAVGAEILEKEGRSFSDAIRAELKRRMDS